MKRANGVHSPRVVNSAAVFVAVITLCSCSTSREPPLQGHALEQQERAMVELQSLLQSVGTSDPPRVTYTIRSLTKLASSDDLLNRAAAILKEHPKLHLCIEVHTDDGGGEEDDEALGLKRADAVKQRLTAQGVSSDAVEVVGYGTSRPLSNDTSAQGRAQNRRVELVVTARY